MATDNLKIQQEYFRINHEIKVHDRVLEDIDFKINKLELKLKLIEERLAITPDEDVVLLSHLENVFETIEGMVTDLQIERDLIYNPDIPLTT